MLEQGAEMQAYTNSDLRRLFQLPPSLVRSLARAGHIHPVAERGKVCYSFQDLLVLRTAAALRAAKVPAARIPAVLLRIREALPSGTSLGALSLKRGGQVTVRDGTTLWEPVTGQYALPLDGLPRPATITPIGATQDTDSPDPAAPWQMEQQFARAVRLEDTDLDAARAAYAECLAREDHVAARINLGRLLHLQGKLADAEGVYRRCSVSSATLTFNLGVLLEDLQREEEAIACYREALALDPDLHDAHFNVARLYERAARPRDALRHLLAYKRAMAAP